MGRSKSRRQMFLTNGVKITILAVLACSIMGISCDHEAATVFRHEVTVPIGEGVKTALAGDPAAGLGQIVSAGIDGLVASIDQAGRSESEEK